MSKSASPHPLCGFLDLIHLVNIKDLVVKSHCGLREETSPARLPFKSHFVNWSSGSKETQFWCLDASHTLVLPWIFWPSFSLSPFLPLSPRTLLSVHSIDTPPPSFSLSLCFTLVLRRCQQRCNPSFSSLHPRRSRLWFAHAPVWPWRRQEICLSNPVWVSQMHRSLVLYSAPRPPTHTPTPLLFAQHPPYTT